MSTYLFGSIQLSLEDEGFADALAVAHAGRQRPKCLCLLQGVEMYVARLGEGFIIKRMPGTGSRHAPDCASYEPPPESSGLGQVLGTAIKEDPTTGDTTLRLGFSMSKFSGRSTMPASASPSDSVVSDGSKLSLRGLLHYLWDQAELTRWQPGFAGRRSWSTVRRQLLLAAENKMAQGEALRSRLIPEVFSVEQRDVLNARRVTQWQHAVAAPGRSQHLMLLIAEIKEIVPARYGFKAIIKHVPDQALALDEQLYRGLGRRFDAELALWGSVDPVTPQWLPIEDAFERQLVERLVDDGRSFIKGLRYNLRRDQCLASATLTDTDSGSSMLFIVPGGMDGVELVGAVKHAISAVDASAWVWRSGSGAMPKLPCARRTRGPPRLPGISAACGDRLEPASSV